ncbi:extracellular solute-binding protein [Paenibacillus silvisoli]|uniref:extracellular solute-binding protein n=1 Tax=Paenibacillus silvisoli TaxID=3110539 RepID=UPI002804933B|nr:extracellular solute-binding protein [Paenibacillus silvisoli]
MNNRKMKALFLGIAALVMMFSAGCSNNSSSTSPTSNDTKGDEQAAEAPIGKYDSPIELTSAVVSADPWNTLPDGDTAESNAFTRAYLDELGIKANIVWSVSGDKRDEKINLEIASDALPDVIMVNRMQFEQLAAAGQLEDLTGLIEKYGNDTMKELYGPDNKVAVDAFTVDGKLLGIPWNVDHTETSHMLYVRADWLKKLNLPEPKTIADLTAIAKAFMTQDVDGTGHHADYGIAMNKDLAATGLFNSFHAYPGIFVKDDASGKLVNGAYVPGMRTAVEQIKAWYESGIIAKDFGAKDHTAMLEDLNSGKVGIHFGGIWEAWGGLQQGKDRDPKVDWKAYPLPSVDGNPAKVGIQPLLVNGVFVVKKGYDHPEALVKMFNLYVEKLLGTPEELSAFGYDNEKGYQPYAYALGIAEPMLRKNYQIYASVKEALETNDASKLTSEQKINYDAIVKYRNGDNSQWFVELCYGPNGTLSLLEYYDQNKLYQLDAYTGVPTTSMIAKGPTISKLWNEMLTKVFMGGDMADYDAFIKKVDSLGNADIEKEVNDFYNKHNK